ncbi:hypothetical protein [Paractinoplanes maris]|uniref:hypothetical protein n=1 Tax=Paractinoplanes maris TaxID=1734446 RepID=UPI002020BE2D|nr:hypothetical protein [Actinoplanes maris]
MDEAPQLQLAEIVQVTYGSLTCMVRCVAGTVRLGETVELRSATIDLSIAAGLTVAVIEYYDGIFMDFVDLGRTALVTVTGPIDVSALRALAPKKSPEHLREADLRLVVSASQPRRSAS